MQPPSCCQVSIDVNEYENVSDEALRQAIMQERSLMTKAKRFGDSAGYERAKLRLETAEAELKRREESRRAK